MSNISYSQYSDRTKAIIRHAEAMESLAQGLKVVGLSLAVNVKPETVENEHRWKSELIVDMLLKLKELTEEL